MSICGDTFFEMVCTEPAGHPKTEPHHDHGEYMGDGHTHGAGTWWDAEQIDMLARGVFSLPENT